MDDNNKENASLRPISLNKRDYPEIYGSEEGKLPPGPKAKPAAEKISVIREAAESAERRGQETAPPPLYPKIIDNGVFNDYILGREKILWSCRGTADSKKQTAKLFPFAAVISLIGLMIILVSANRAAGFLAGAPLLAAGAVIIKKYLRGGYDSYCALTDSRIIFLCGKKIKTEYIYKIDEAKIIPRGRRSADVKLYISDGDRTVLEGLDINQARELRSLIEQEKTRKQKR